MEKRFVLRGFGVGGLGGLLAFVFARLEAEPQLQQAIDYERGRDAAAAVLRKAAGPMGPDLFSRGVQRNVGIGVGLVLFGVAMGGLFAVAYVLVQRRTHDRVRPRTLALLIAAAGFAGLYLVPFLKYPANPPAIGHEETIGDRTLLYVAMVAISLISLIAAALAGRRLAARFGTWNASLIAGAAFVAVVAVAMAILPPLGHLPANVAEYGRHATETPLPLRDAHGRIVYPGFPADVLFEFRLYSLISQMILWATIGLAFGPLVERMPAYRSRRAGAETTPAAIAT
jgi:Probable cobalt transporter subunit (CbtA)